MTSPLHYQIDIRAARPALWETMLGDAGYRDWTSAFSAGSYYQGRWETGADIRFLGPSGDGMRARIEQAIPPEYVSIEHLGELRADGTASGADWQGAYERYRLTEQPDATTRLDVELTGVPDEYREMMNTMWPKALARLKAMCEGY